MVELLDEIWLVVVVLGYSHSQEGHHTVPKAAKKRLTQPRQVHRPNTQNPFVSKLKKCK